jgi:hypothetical protein
MSVRIEYKNQTSNASEPDVVNVYSASDLPAIAVANKVYVIHGVITTSQSFDVQVDNVILRGRGGREKDKIIYTGAGAFIRVTDVDFEIQDLTLSATQSTSNLIQASNFDLVNPFNSGRDKTLTIINSKFFDCYNVMTVFGFDLVDISNVVFEYVQATTNGLDFTASSKIEISSCEFIRWYDVSTNPTPSGFATVPMINLNANFSGVGYGAILFTGLVIHPQQTQDAINISNSCTINYGLIASNTFVDANLTTGILANFDYDVQNTIIIQANTLIENSNAKGILSLTGNTVFLDNSTTNPIVIKGANTVGGGGFTNPITFPVAQRVITSVADASFTYNSTISGNFLVLVNATVELSGNGTITLRARQNGTQIPIPLGKTQIRSSIAESISFALQGIANLGDVFDFEVESDAGQDVLISEFTVNGYQF